MSSPPTSASEKLSSSPAARIAGRKVSTHVEQTISLSSSAGGSSAHFSDPYFRASSPQRHLSLSIGDTLLSDYAQQLGPLHTHGASTREEGKEDNSPAPLASKAPSSITESTKKHDGLTAPPRLHFRAGAKPYITQHRKGGLSLDAVPRQTIMKALASQHATSESHPRSITATVSGLMSAQGAAGGWKGADYSERLAATLAEISQGTAKDSPMTRYLQSPCFFHKRFDDAVDIEKVLEEIVDDEWMSHSRLMQTATGVREVSKQLQRRPIRRAVKNVMIVTKARDNHLVTLTRELAFWLMKTPRYGSPTGVTVYVDAKLRNSTRFDSPGLVSTNPAFNSLLRYWTPDLCWSSPEKFDLVLTLGGDGTVLYTSWLFQRIVPPILSFSLGSLGFLTNFEFSSYSAHLNRIMGDAGMRVSMRMRFTCTVYRAALSSNASSSSASSSSEMVEGEQFEVLNELVIDRGPSPYVSNLELYGDDDLLTVVQADGCIFSTPTGSTAYSLSAGGSLVHPDIPAILLTPICPHTLSFRPMLLNDTMLLRVCVPKNSRATAYCSFDGKGRIELRQGDHVSIQASQYPFPTVVSGGSEWFDSISRTLRWNTRGAMQKGWHGEDGVDSIDGNLPAEGKPEHWDIDTEESNIDSGYSAYSGESSLSASPLKRGVSALGTSSLSIGGPMA
jgi:NAD+ kinase